MHEFQNSVGYQHYMRNWEECNERMTLERVTYHSAKKSEEEGHLGRPPPPAQKRFS